MKPFRLTPLLVVGPLLGTAGCGLRQQPLERWVPGTYEYRTTLPGTGDVAGHISVGTEGVINVTSTVGPCARRLEPVRRPGPTMLELGPWDTGAFVCGTDHRVRVWLGYAGGPPIRGEVSNQRTDSLTTYGETTCREYQVTEAGERICLVWNVEPKTERRTTGATAPFWIVTDSLATPP